MSHHFIVPTNENGMILDPTLDADLALAMGSVFKYAHVFIYSHGWWTNATRAMEGYNRFTIEFSHHFRSTRHLATLPTLNVGMHWPSTLTEDRVSVENYFQALSFYTMEKRADTVGENSVYTILRVLLGAGAAPPPGLHLLGHSFGAKVVCRALQRLVAEGTKLPAGMTCDVALLQAAFDNNELEPANDYGGLTRIPGLRLLVTRSAEDKALASLYPKAHRLARRPRLLGPVTDPVPALGDTGPSREFAERFGPAAPVDVGPDFAGDPALAKSRLVVADLTRLHQAHAEEADAYSGHHSDIFHREVYELLASFYFG